MFMVAWKIFMANYCQIQQLNMQFVSFELEFDVSECGVIFFSHVLHYCAQILSSFLDQKILDSDNVTRGQ